MVNQSYSINWQMILSSAEIFSEYSYKNENEILNQHKD